MSRVVVERKYYLGEETVLTKEDGSTIMLYRIIANKNFGNVQKGDIGGWVESESNLSQIDDCWIYDNAIVCGKSRVEQKAAVFNNAYIDGESIISGRATISDFAYLDNVEASGNCTISDYANIRYASIYGNAEIKENSVIHGDNYRDDIFIFGNSLIHGFVTIKGRDISIHDDVNISGFVKIGPYVDIFGDVTIMDFVTIRGKGAKKIRIYGDDTKISGHVFARGYGDIVDTLIKGMTKLIGKININCDMEYNKYDNVINNRISQYMIEDDD